MSLHLEDCYQGFRERYLDYATLTRQLQAWADAWPELVSLASLGTTPEGRELWLLTVGPEPGRIRPGVWIDGNMHAVELAGSSVALAIAEEALRLHVGDGADRYPESMREALREAVFHVCPRISPDGAEAVLTRGGYVRSVPRRYTQQSEPYWLPEDVDGDGVLRFMRRADPGGEFVADPAHPGLMLPRRVQDPPPYYRIYPEGTIEHWDGHTIPAPAPLAGTTDLNRNFPWQWRPEPEQLGAGAFPGSEPETRALLEWSSRHPELYAWLNLHTYGGVFIRPLGHAPDARMSAGDLALYRQLSAWAEEQVGYPTVSAYEEFTYEPEKPVHGDLDAYAYHQRGCIAEVCELWDLFRRAGLPETRPFVGRYKALRREDLRRLADWDRRENRGRVFRPWRRCAHPQLGEVEIGGPDPRVGIWNPPYEHLPELCERISRYWLHVSSLLPRVVIEELGIEPAGDDVWRVVVVVANHGYLPTWGLDSSRELPWNDPLYARVTAHGCRLIAEETARLEVGHLAGWGRGMGQRADLPGSMHSAGSRNRRTLSFMAAGAGTLALRIGNARVGWLEREVALGSEQ